MKLPPTILMGDVVGSRKLSSLNVQDRLKDAVTAINAEPGIRILSPLTITLGDEFQGVVSDVAAAVQILFAFEEYRLRKSLPFRLHFVTYIGSIDTELNEDIAHGMLGPGLTHARTLLTEKKRGRRQYTFGSLLPDDNTPTQHSGPRPLGDDDLQEGRRGPPAQRAPADSPLPYAWLRFQLRQLTGVFAMLERLTSHWKPKDFPLIADMITHPDDDARVGTLNGKNRSQIWKRRKTLRIDDFFTLRGLATEIAAPTTR